MRATSNWTLGSISHDVHTLSEIAGAMVIIWQIDRRGRISLVFERNRFLERQYFFAFCFCSHIPGSEGGGDFDPDRRRTYCQTRIVREVGFEAIAQNGATPTLRVHPNGKSAVCCRPHFGHRQIPRTTTSRRKIGDAWFTRWKTRIYERENCNQSIPNLETDCLSGLCNEIRTSA